MIIQGNDGQEDVFYIQGIINIIWWWNLGSKKSNDTVIIHDMDIYKSNAKGKIWLWDWKKLITNILRALTSVTVI